MIRYYKVMRGWGDDYISIEEKDLMRAISAKLLGKVLIKGGLIDGNKIEMIVPDYHKTMGWNYGYKMESADYEQVRGRAGDMQNIISLASEQVKEMIAGGQAKAIDTLDFVPKKKENIVLANPEIKALSEKVVNHIKI